MTPPRHDTVSGRTRGNATSDPDWVHDVDHLRGAPVEQIRLPPGPQPHQTPGSVLARVARRVFAAGAELQRRASGPMSHDMTDADVAAKLATMRRTFESLAARQPLPRGVTMTADAIGGVHCETVTDRHADTRRVVLHLHGGAYVMCSPVTHRGLAAAASRVTAARVVVPAYRLAPEHPFPAGLTDALAVYRALLAAGTDPADLVVTGDSAGGGLGLALLLALREVGAPLPAGYVGISPWTDLAGTGASIRERESIDPWISGHFMHVPAEAYAGAADVTHPLVSPLHADLGGLPPMLVQVGTHEILFDDAARLVVRARACGVDARLSAHNGMWHVFQAIHWLPDSRRAWREYGRFVTAVTHADPPRSRTRRP